jgi:hypothetical protein
MSTRTAEEILEEARNLAYSEDYSLTEGWNQDVATDLLNLAQNSVYHAITQIDNPPFVKEYVQDIIQAQQSYDIPFDVFMRFRIIDVRYLWGNAPYEFVTLKQGMIQDRFDYPINIPDVYCIRSKKILLSPTPNLTRLNSLVVNYQERLRTLDVRRGIIADRDTSPVTFTLDFTVNSKKNATMQEYADSQLDKVGYCCLVDTFGQPVVTSIPLQGYDSITQILTANPNYTIPADELAVLDAYIAADDPVYVVRGIYGSTNSELDPQCEDYMIEFVVQRLLRLQSNNSESLEQKQTMAEALEQIVNAYRRYRPSVYPIRWVGHFGRSSFPFGRRGIF